LNKNLFEVLRNYTERPTLWWYKWNYTNK